MSAFKLPTAPRVLIVDDNEDDVFILTHVLRKSGVAHPIDCAVNGLQCIKYLQALLAESTEPSSLPALILLDLKMPLVDGHEVLAWIRSQDALHSLPIYMLSSSELALGISRARENGAADYWVKPSSLSEYHQLAARVKSLLPPLAEPAQVSLVL
jgi:two-component system response regulator